ncbi:hypothetical protein RJD11_12225 [Bacillus velezensis]|uniref:hypothetical protein n=1 Tax=Bacillus TaxID=1386 RepID=UPI001C527344|nr:MULTISPECIES: hypothetical protein [Bacillus amyloliquefaciens group]QXP99301.1 hypothetical protein KVY05_21285 [Bacillus velezensis]UHH01359.1 hypothetical protein LUA14_12150 [Bacillus amyloliquefaciens]ULR21106.1 hypothetical protein MJE83_12145 [Bacillus velezensis]UVW07849.1 hypothetical protein NX856_12185 [Bacillus velezensis]WHL75156.1 hypothetical protein QLH34_12170 [Bacillus velezensis]
MADKLTVESYQELKIKGHTETDIAKHFGVSYQTLHKWKKKNLKGKPVKKDIPLEETKKTTELLRSSKLNLESDNSLKDQLKKAKDDIAALEQRLKKEQEEQQRLQAQCSDLDRRRNVLRETAENLKKEKAENEKRLNELRIENSQFKQEIEKLKKASKTSGTLKADSLAALGVYKRATLQLLKEQVDSGDAVAELLHELLQKEE